MLKQMTVAVCDICGATEHARLVFDSRNDYLYTLPEGWTTARANNNVHMCPACADLLQRKVYPLEKRNRA